MNKSHSFSFDETMFLTYQKVPKVKIACSYSKEGAPHEKINQGLTDNNQCLTNIFKI